jgi:hypothetical protein
LQTIWIQMVCNIFEVANHLDPDDLQFFQNANHQDPDDLRKCQKTQIWIRVLPNLPKLRATCDSMCFELPPKPIDYANFQKVTTKWFHIFEH